MRRCARISPNASNCCSAITLPACLGFAVIAPHVANVILGADFRELAAQIMPIIAVAVIFQILTQQYLHASFLLSGRNSFYLINTASIIAANVILSYVLVGHYGTIGAAWARLGADVVGFVCALVLSRFAFPIPLPLGRLALTVIAGAGDGARSSPPSTEACTLPTSPPASCWPARASSPTRPCAGCSTSPGSAGA